MSSTSRNWLIVCVLIVALICLQIDEPANKKYYRSRLVKYEDGGEPEEFEFSVSFCYPLSPKNNYCNCSRQLSCYNNSMERKNKTKDIVDFFERCMLDKLVKVRQAVSDKKDEQDDSGPEDFNDHDQHGDRQQEIEGAVKYELNKQDEICTTYTYARIQFRKALLRFVAEYEHHQPFRVLVSVKNTNDRYSHAPKPVFARHCHLYKVDFENCFHSEARVYELSISRLNLYSADADYRRACCSGLCESVGDRLEQVKMELNRSDIDCGECAIYCGDSWQYAFDIDR